VGYICSDDYLVAVTCGRDRTVCNVLDITGPHPVRSSALGCAQFTVRDRKYSEEKKLPVRSRKRAARTIVINWRLIELNDAMLDVRLGLVYSRK